MHGSRKADLTAGVGVTTDVDSALIADQIKVLSGAVLDGEVIYNDLDNSGTINGAETRAGDRGRRVRCGTRRRSACRELHACADRRREELAALIDLLTLDPSARCS